ncbi:MAG: metal ABC transporter permease [Phycisphaerales bacterium]
MKTIDYLTTLGDVYYPSIVAALAIAILAGILSIIVVLKRLAFVGQGISHAAFGGVGLSLAAGAYFGVAVTDQMMDASIIGFSILAALWIAAISKGTKGRADTAIGIVLAASMALGFLFYAYAARNNIAASPLPSMEGVLFGDILAASWKDAWTTVVLSVSVLGVVWYFRRPMILWAFDESIAEIYRVSAPQMMRIFMVALAIAVVNAVGLSGIVLASAMFVLPGASALWIGSKLRSVFVYSVVCAILGVVFGFVMGFEFDWAIGPSIVLAQCIIYSICALTSWIRSR